VRHMVRQAMFPVRCTAPRLCADPGCRPPRNRNRVTVRDSDVCLRRVRL